MVFDRIIIGGGLYGVYAGLLFSEAGYKSVILEYDEAILTRATSNNQLRVHNGYHYPRSMETSLKSQKYFERFTRDFHDCVNDSFQSIYAVAKNLTWTNAEQFIKFCRDSSVYAEEMDPDKYFHRDQIEKCFITEEFTYDPVLLKENLLSKLAQSDVEIIFNARMEEISKRDGAYEIKLADGRTLSSEFVLNTSYASANQIVDRLGLPHFNLKYELCEVIVTKVNSKYDNVGITLMDGPFFSMIPMGKSKWHTLTSVNHTPHYTSYDRLPEFHCQQNDLSHCSPEQLANCNTCPYQPQSNFPFMVNLTKKYVRDIEFEFVRSNFSIKPILTYSEISDSRPTLISTQTEDPTFVSVLSGKINTIYDLESLL